MILFFVVCSWFLLCVFLFLLFFMHYYCFVLCCCSLVFIFDFWCLVLVLSFVFDGYSMFIRIAVRVHCVLNVLCSCFLFCIPMFIICSCVCS